MKTPAITAIQLPSPNSSKIIMSKQIFTTLLLMMTIHTFGQVNNFQAVADASLLKMLKAQDAEKGMVIVVETVTGKVIAFSGKKNSGKNFINDSSFINTPAEPGALMTPISLAVLLDNTALTFSDSILLKGIAVKLGNTVVADNKQHRQRYYSMKEVIAISSNEGIAKVVWKEYHKDAPLFFKKVNKLMEKQLEDKASFIRYAYGYNFKIAPFKLLSFYNGIANGGRIASLSFDKAGMPENMFEKESTNPQLKQCLQAACQKGGTAAVAFEAMAPEMVAGKTATIFAKDKSTTTSFVGFFPFEQPLYTCMVIIKNKPTSPLLYSADVAAPVFKDIVDAYIKEIKP